MRIVVFGAAGQLGRDLVRVLIERGHAVCAAVRRPPDAIFPASAENRMVDARERRAVRAAIDGVDAVVNVIGGGTLRRNNVASSASAIVVPAAQEAQVKRYIALSAGMVALDWPFFKHVLRPLIFRHILAEHRCVE